MLQVLLKSIEASKQFRIRKTTRQICTTRCVVVQTYCWTALVFFLLVLPACGQSFNFNIGGGAGFPLGTTADFVHNSYDLVIGGGKSAPPPKMNVEFMFHGIPVNQDIINQVGVSDRKGRLYVLSGNLMIVRQAVEQGELIWLGAGDGIAARLRLSKPFC